MISKNIGPPPSLCKLFFRRSTFAAVNALIDPRDRTSTFAAASAASGDLRSHCYSLLRLLIGKNFLSSAHSVLDRLVDGSSPREAISAIEFADLSGLSPDLPRLLRRLLAVGQLDKAEAVFHHASEGNTLLNPAVTESMIICYSKLGKLDQAKALFDSAMETSPLPCSETYNVLISSLCKKSLLLEALEVFFSGFRARLLPNPRCFRLLIHCLCLKGFLDEARLLLDLMLSAGIRSTAHLFKSLVYSLCKSGRVSDAEGVCSIMESYGFYLDKRICTTMLYGYCREGRMDVALSVLEKMMGTANCEPDEYAYNTIIHGLLQLGYVDSSWDFFDVMVERGFRPNVVSYSLMIHWYCKNNRVDCGLELLHSMERYGLAPNLPCYTIVLSFLCKEARFSEVGKLLDNILDSSLIPDQVMLIPLLNSLPREYDSPIVWKTLQAVAKMNPFIDISRLLGLLNNYNDEFLQEVELILNSIVAGGGIFCEVILNFLICILCSQGNFSAVHMLMDKYEPTITTYNFLIKYLCKEGRMQDVDSLISTMQARGTVLNNVTFSTVIDAHCKRGDVDSAFQVLDIMHGQGLNPTVSTYDAIIGAFCKEGRLHRAEATFSLMLDSGTEPDERVYTTLLHGYSQNGIPIDACNLFDEILANGFQPSAHAYLSVINVLLKCNMTRKACEYLGRMLEDGVVPGTFLYTILINQFFKKGDVDFALLLVQLMVKDQVEPDIFTYGTVISGLARNVSGRRMHPSVAIKLKESREILLNMLSPTTPRPIKMAMCRTNEGKISLALALVRDLRDVGSVPDLYIYNGMINCLCRGRSFADVFEILRSMEEAKVSPNLVTYAILMGNYFTSGRTDLAVGLFNELNEKGLKADNVIYNILVKGLSMAERVMEALSVVYMMQKRGIVPGMFLYDRILCWFCNNNLLEPAFMLFEEMVSYGYKPVHGNCRRLLWLLLEKNNLKAFNRVFVFMLKRGKAPGEIIKETIIKLNS